MFARGHVDDLTAAGAPCNCRLVTSSSRTTQTAAPRRPAGQFERQKVRQVSSRGNVALIVEVHVRSSRVTSCLQHQKPGLPVHGVFFTCFIHSTADSFTSTAYIRRITILSVRTVLME